MQSTQTIQNLKISITHEELYAEICRRSFYQFVKYFWDTVIAETPVWNWHIEYLCDQLQAVGERVKRREPKEFDYFIINVPPGSSKSTIVSEMYPMWCWTIDATQRFICGSFSSTPAEDIAGKCYKIYTSDKYKKLYPSLHNKKAGGGKTNFSNGLGGERYTTSTGSGITGIHAHQIIVDDPMNPKVAASTTERETANKWVQETLSTRKVNKDVTVTIIVMQRLHEMDTTGYLVEKVKDGMTIKHICIPAELSNDVKPVELRDNYVDGIFDPVRLSKQTLQKERIALGSYGYAGQMQQRPSPAEGGIIKKDWFAIIQRDRLLDYTIPHFQIDTAYTDDEKNDPTAVVCYYMENDKVHVFNRTSVWKEFPDLIKWLPEFIDQNGYTNRSKIYVEPKASGKSVVQTIRKGTKLNIIESVAPDDDKVTRAHIVSPKIESGQVILHAGQWSDPFVTQVTSFPNAQHDDEFDCLIAIIMRELMVEKKTKKKLGGFFH